MGQEPRREVRGDSLCLQPHLVVHVLLPQVIMQCRRPRGRWLRHPNDFRLVVRYVQVSCAPAARAWGIISMLEAGKQVRMSGPCMECVLARGQLHSDRDCLMLCLRMQEWGAAAYTRTSLERDPCMTASTDVQTS